MKNLKFVVVLALALGSSSVAFAEESAVSADTGADNIGGLWTALDANKDGAVSKDEASASQEVSAQWNLLDLNQDGVLSEKEFALIDLSK